MNGFSNTDVIRMNLNARKRGNYCTWDVLQFTRSAKK